jgi:outer membrane usher protein
VIPARRLALLGAAACLLPVLVVAEDAALRESVFGKREAREQSLDVGVRIDDTVVGDVGIRIKLERLLAIDRDALVALLQSFVDDDALACVEQLPERLEPVMLEPCGVEARFDASALELQLVLAVERRRERQLAMRPGRMPASTRQRQASSAYLNLALSGRDSPDRASSLATLFDGALGRGTSTLEFDGACAASRCEVDSASLVHDQPERLRRWQLGDLSRPRAGMLALPGMRGIMLGTDFELQPEMGFTPQLQAPLELDRPGTLEVWLDGRLLRRDRLGPGRYRLADFPLGFGWNEAVLRVTDDAGRVQTRSLQTYVDFSLLDDGISRYSLALGYAPIALQRGPDQFDRPWILAAEHARGLRLGTLGLAAVSAPELHYHAAELSWSQGWERHLWGAQLGCSHRESVGCRISVALRQDAVGGAQGWQHQVQADGWSSRWLDVVDAQPRGAAFAASWRAYRPLTERWQLALATQLRRQSGRREDAALGAQLSARLAGGWSLRLGLERTVQRENEVTTGDFGVSINLGWLFDRARQSITVDYDSIDQAGSLAWQHARGGQSSGWSAGVLHSESPLATLQSASARLRAERWSGEASLARTDTEGRESRELGLLARTALVYAEGAFGVTERVNGGFAILQPAAADVGPVYVNPYGEDFLASDRGPGPAVVNNLRPYQPRELAISMPSLPAGRDPGELLPNVVVPYKGGLRVALGGQRSINLQARVLDAQGEAVSMLPGTLRRLDCAPVCSAPLPVFVGRGGRLTAMGLSPGRWTLELQGTSPRRHDFDVPVDTHDDIDLGELRP